ncbi:MAG: phytanoyl-CoA dioxygenase, partial [Verrucomicrobia bacterium]|nr:phytanoyl-CoA dioxygenase [Verrucomicrobiota bacterium]
NPIAEGYYFSEQQIINQQNILILMTDKNIINLAQNYLGCEPILSIVAMWWSCSGKFSEDASRALAQMYHFDMDRPKWLKVFFYINDVSLKNGPHVFIRKTHKTGNFPQPLLAKGYSRLTDNEINQYFSQEDQLKIVGPRGSAFAEDTRGIHKGLIPENGYRLVLQLEFSNSLFGAKYEKDLKLKKTLLSRESLQFIENHPKIYSRFQVAE